MFCCASAAPAKWPTAVRLFSSSTLLHPPRGWTLSSNGGALIRRRKLASFAACVQELNRIAALAEKANHHPDLSIKNWNELSIALTTHEKGNSLSAKDMALANAINELIDET
mmetsp:Transcript_10420/g.26205  ORF Transcript_10420/g.26205 Transcript_10420/m.26205 type:complete len:112 (-) Transcript_10420:1290-1625(-)